MIAEAAIPNEAFQMPEMVLPSLNQRLADVAQSLQRWTGMRDTVPGHLWSYPPVVTLVSKLDWEVLLLGHAVSDRGHAVAEIDQRLSEVETTIRALHYLLQGGDVLH